MKIRFYEEEYSICQITSLDNLDMTSDLFFFAKTPDELSLVCPSGSVPQSDTIKINPGWSCFRIEGTLDFNMVGVLSSISSVLASNGISIFALSTFRTDYILIKSTRVADARVALSAAGYDIV